MIRARHYSPRTEKAYARLDPPLHPLPRHAPSRPRWARPRSTRFLSHLAIRGKVSASTQNQAFSALLFLYRDVLETRARRAGGRRPRQAPAAPARGADPGRGRPRPRPLRGRAPAHGHRSCTAAGLRLLECCRLRVKDLDFERGEIIVRDGKGRKDRVDHAAPTAVAPRCAPTSSASATSTRPTSAAAPAASRSPTPSPASTPTPTASGPGSGSSRPRASTSTPRPAAGAATTSTNPSSSAPSAIAVRAAGLDQAGHLPHPPPLLRHPPARGRLRHPHHPGAPRPPRRQHHDDLHPRPQPRRPRRAEPPGSLCHETDPKQPNRTANPTPEAAPERLPTPDLPTPLVPYPSCRYPISSSQTNCSTGIIFSAVAQCLFDGPNETANMNGDTRLWLLAGVLVGVAATVTMDVLGSVSRRIGLAAGAKGQWVGRVVPRHRPGSFRSREHRCRPRASR